jgi:hypothetical protein
LSHPHLHRDRALFYTVLIRQVLGPETRPVMVVDWSDRTTGRRWHVLRASLPVGGRALTRYDEVPPVGNRCVPHALLRALHRLLPAGVTPILVTDVGFRSSWFLAVERLGWTFVWRVRNRYRGCVDPAFSWVSCKSLYSQALTTPSTLGLCELVCSGPFPCRLVLVERTVQAPDSHSVWGQNVRSGHSRKQAAGNRESW